MTARARLRVVHAKLRPASKLRLANALPPHCCFGAGREPAVIAAAAVVERAALTMAAASRSSATQRALAPRQVSDADGFALGHGDFSRLWLPIRRWRAVFCRVFLASASRGGSGYPHLRSCRPRRRAWFYETIGRICLLRTRRLHACLRDVILALPLLIQ
jgi:hypothetical protein